MRWYEILESIQNRRLNETPVNPTKRFIPVHGNYCGPGNRGGKPVDDLDKACFRHDCEYDRSYHEDEPTRTERQLKADEHFVKRVIKIAADKSLPKMVRLKAYAAAKYFMRRISKHGALPPLD
jgi:hypothetical protein